MHLSWEQPGPLGGVRVLWRGVGAMLAKDARIAKF